MKGDAVFGRQATAPVALAKLEALLSHAFRQRTAVADNPEQSQLVRAHVAGNERLTPAEQVDIYRRQFWMRHEEVLEEDYPGLLGVLGEPLFGDLVVAYLLAHPPTQPNLRDLGAKLPGFLRSYSGIPGHLAPLAQELADYELCFVDVFDGLDPPTLDRDLLTSLTPDDWERARLVLSPLVRRLHLSYPVHRIRLAARDAKANGTKLELPDPREVFLALFRRDLVVHFEELEPNAFRLLDALASGETLLAACMRVAEGKSGNDVQRLIADIREWFRSWAQNGFIAEVIVPPADS